MSDLTPEQREALDAARHLAEHGVPIFIAKPALGPDGEWDPDATGEGVATGYKMPARWQHKKADPTVVDRWRPGDALCAVMGHGVDAIDVDPRNGGTESFAELERQGLVPDTYGRQLTPSGGFHLLVASLGVRSRDGVVPGVDIKAGDEDGAGHGFAFLAPTVKRVKNTDQVAAYRWDEAPSLNGTLAGDSTGTALAELVRSTRERLDYDGPSYDGPAFDALSEAEQTMAEREVKKRVAFWREHLAEAVGWPDDKRDDKHRGWEALVRDCAWALALLAVSPWTGLSAAEAKTLYEEIVPDEIAADPACAGKWTSSLLKRASERPVEPPPWVADFDDVDPEDTTSPSASSSGGKKLPPLAVRLRWHVEQHYDLFPGGAEDPRVYAQRKTGGRAELVGGPFVLRATRGTLLGDQSANLTNAATEAAKALSWEHEDATPRELALRVHYRPGRIVLDLGQAKSSRCVVVTPDGWTVEEQPPEDVVFVSSSHVMELPTPERGGDVEELRHLLHWSEDDSRWLLIKGWLPVALLTDTPRPLLGFFGPQGSAKTTTGRLVAGVLDPKPEGVLGGGFGKSRQDDETKALKSFIPSWDNVGAVSSEGSDFFSRMVTGDLIQRRRLYSDADLVSIHYRRTGVITGVTLPTGIKPDTLDRLIVLSIKPLTKRLPERRINAEWKRLHPRVLAGVLDLAVGMLARLDEARNPRRLRMADYAEALWAVDPALYEAYADNVTTAREDVAEEDPFIQTIIRWIEDEGGSWQGTSTEGLKAASKHRPLDPTDPMGARADERVWWPKNPRSFSETLTRHIELLHAVGITLQEVKSNGRRIKRLISNEVAEALEELL